MGFKRAKRHFFKFERTRGRQDGGRQNIFSGSLSMGRYGRLWAGDLQVEKQALRPGWRRVSRLPGLRTTRLNFRQRHPRARP